MVTPRDRGVILQKQPGNPIAQFFLLLPMARSKTRIPLCFALQRFTPVTSMSGASVAVLMHNKMSWQPGSAQQANKAMQRIAQRAKVFLQLHKALLCPRLLSRSAPQDCSTAPPQHAKPCRQGMPSGWSQVFLCLCHIGQSLHTGEHYSNFCRNPQENTSSSAHSCSLFVRMSPFLLSPTL